MVKRYIPDLYYFRDLPDFDSRKAIVVTAQTIGQWCSHYKAQTIAFKKDNETKEGELPKEKYQKTKFVKNLTEWVIDNSGGIELFRLFLDTKPVKDPTDDNSYITKFDHHDDTCCWIVELTEGEFKILQSEYKKNNLPVDLFYDLEMAIKVPINNWLTKIIGGEACKIYSPKQWEKKAGQGDKIL